MKKDLLIALISSINILLYSFIGLNYQAFQSIAKFEPGEQINQTEEILKPIIEKQLPLTKKTLSLPRKTSDWKGQLSIPKIHLETIVQYQSQASVEKLSKLLSQGAISLSPYLKSHKPGRMMIFGHSSDYLWKQNPNHALFALLPQLEPGDLIRLQKGNQIQAYQVQSTHITDPSLKSLLNSPPKSHQLILSTCYPIGFSNKRFSVVAVPI